MPKTRMKMNMFPQCFLLLWTSFLVRSGLSLFPSSSGGDIVDLFHAGTSSFSWSKGAATCYRIPSLVCAQKTGVLLAVVAERMSSTCSDEAPSNLVSRRSIDGGRTWEPAILAVPHGPSRAEMSPMLIEDSNTGTIFLFFNRNVTSATGCHCNMAYVTSTDRGASWSSQIRDIPPTTGVYGSALASGITVSKSGRLVACMRKICRNSCPQDYRSKAMFSDDHGATWQSSSFLGPGTTECQIAELSDGRLVMNIRPYIGWNGTKNVRLQAYSNDQGSSWSPASPVNDLIDYGFADEGSIVSDPAAKKVYFSHPNSHNRANLTLYQSNDDAQTWPIQSTVYAGDSEYSDTAILNPGPGSGTSVGVLFERDGYKMVSFRAMQFQEPSTDFFADDGVEFACVGNCTPSLRRRRAQGSTSFLLGGHM